VCVEMQDPLWQELYAEVQKKYGDFDPVKKEVETFLNTLNIFSKTKPKSNNYNL
jgi:hypothetical protein